MLEIFNYYEKDREALLIALKLFTETANNGILIISILKEMDYRIE
jgi:hypothetical protein